MKRLPTRHCDECHNFKYVSGPCMLPICTRGHKPRFYMPKGPLDETAGYKRKCKDFKEKKATP